MTQDETSGGWRRPATGADGETGRAAAGHPTRGETAAHAGAFLAAHA
ncbi:hypothetical protein AB0F92_19370 [Kitasatospora aureofaciens]|nr:hypothetical protein BOQ63_035735 [Streptomyces viridifaciens]